MLGLGLDANETAALAAPPIAFAAWLTILRNLGSARLKPLLPYRKRYNQCLAAYSFAAFAHAFFILYTDGRLQSPHGVLCVASDRIPFFWFGSKIVEMTDTAFLVAAGRNPSNLHVWHHALTPSIVLLDYLRRPSPLFLVGTALNSATHTLMYTYFSHSNELKWLRAIVQ